MNIKYTVVFIDSKQREFLTWYADYHVINGLRKIRDIISFGGYDPKLRSWLNDIRMCYIDLYIEHLKQIDN